jgi:tetratricopeptide (TPR) repeat protein
LILAGLTGGGVWIYSNRPKPDIGTKFVQNIRQDEAEVGEKSNVSLVEPGKSALVDNKYHTYQTFNNCGPATLSMILNWYGVKASQSELGDQMRPYQIASGDNDDKTIFTYEFTDWAQKYGLKAVDRRNGDIELLKRFTANGILVVVKTWLHPGEDIGHFRIVRGFDEDAGVIIQDDSYEGPNKKIAYFDFLAMWQPFNYDYIVVYTAESEEKVMAILGDEKDEQISWQNTLTRAQKEGKLDPNNFYPDFNASVASYHLGDYQASVEAFEKVEGKLPRRMLWYQIEPILAYQKLGNYDRVFEIIQRVLDNGNRAFSELYMIRGEIYLESGEKDKAREQFEQALLYNQNLNSAQEALDSLQ